MRIKSRKLISLFLSILMILSIVPTNILAESWINGAGYDTYGGGGGGGRIIREFENKLNSMNGYKVSIWYCPAEYPDGSTEPVFDWSADNEKVIQVGKTMYYRRQHLQIKNTLEDVLPNIYNDDTIYEQTTLNRDWTKGKRKTEKDGFKYFSTQTVYEMMTPGQVEANLTRINDDILNMAWEYIPFGRPESEWNPAEKGLVDWIQRLFDMENPKNIDINKITRKPNNTTVFGYSYSYPGISHYGVYNQDTFQLYFPAAMAKGDDAKYEASIEYLKSYFLSPAFLNEFFYLQRSNEHIEEGDVTLRNFLMGDLNIDNYSFEKGQYKLYIEPVLFRAYNNTDGLMCMSWRDVMLEHQYRQPNNNGFCQLNTLLPQLTNSFTLDREDESLMYNGTLLGKKSGTFKPTKALESSDIIPMAKDNLNTLGVMVITSPSLNAYIPTDTPEVIKTYSVLTGINEDGSFKYEKFQDSTCEKLDFYVDETGEYTLYPMVTLSENVEGGKLILNDIVTTDKEIDISSDTEWTNSNLITGISGGSQDSGLLAESAQDIVGYRLGILTGSDLFFEAYSEEVVNYLSSLEDYIKDRADVYDTYFGTLQKTQEKILEESVVSSNYGMGSCVYFYSHVGILDEAVVKGLIGKSVMAMAKSVMAMAGRASNSSGGSSSTAEAEREAYDSLGLVDKKTGEPIESADKLWDYAEENGLKLNETQIAIGQHMLISYNNALNYNLLIVNSDENNRVLKFGKEEVVLSEDAIQKIETIEGEYNFNMEVPLEMGFLLPDSNGVHVPSKLNDSVKSKLSRQNVGKNIEDIDMSVVEALNSTIKVPNTLILRYLVVPTGVQMDVVDLYKDGVKIGSILGDKQDLTINGNTVTINKPKVLVEGTPKLVEYVTNADFPIKDISGGVLPALSGDAVSGTVEGTISNYPTKPYPHNLYVRWRVDIEGTPGTPGSSGGSTSIKVPEWRLSKLVGTNDVKGGYTYMSLPITTGCCGEGRLNGTTGYVSRPYTVVNANGKVNDGSYSPINMKYNNWLHSATEHTGMVGNVSVYSPTSVVTVDGIINAVKSTDTSGLKSANWLSNQWTTNNYLSNDYAISTASNSSQFNSAEHQIYVKNDTLKLNTLNLNSYSNTWPSRHSHKKGGHCHRWINSKTISTTLPSYIPYYADIQVTFDRYNQVNTDSRLLSVASKTETENTYTTLTYQPGDTIKVYPEYGMLFTSDSNDGNTNIDRSSIKWMVGDQARSIKPAIYQTLRFKVFVQPNSTGSSVATDSRALTAKNKIADATAKNKQMIYKGSSVNTAFQLYRDNSKNTAALLTVKTFALDYNDEVKTSDGKTVQNAWGMDAYKPENYHTNLMNNINKKATAYEKLYIKEDGATYNGGVKQQQTNEFTLSGSNYTTFVHKLIIRGGKLIGVKVQDRNDKSYTTMTMAQLKANNTYADLYDAIIESKLYNESNDKNATVLSTFEHQTGNALSEDLYVNKLEVARQNIDGITTPDSSKVVMNAGWYSEDTTVLVMKEYITNYKVPSISFSDKLSLQITGLNTPMNKTEFFNKIARGHVYLKYDLGVKTAMGENTNVYFEYDSSNTYQISNKVKVADRKMGYVGTDYIVPNVSITDTTRQ